MEIFCGEMGTEPGKGKEDAIYYKVGFVIELAFESSSVALRVLLSYYPARGESLLTRAFGRLTHCSACPMGKVASILRVFFKTELKQSGNRGS